MERGAITDDPAAVAAAETGDKGLKKDAIGFLDGLVRVSSRCLATRA